MANTDNFDPKSVKKLSALEILKRVGPGIIMTGIVIGPGNITTSAMLGANYGYDMIWIIIPIILMAIIFMMVSYRISMLTGMPLLHAIRHYYGNAAAAFCGVCLFLTCFFFTMGNVSGTGAGMNLLFGLDWKIGAAIMLVVLIIVYFAKNVYSKIEIGITICIVAMIIAFYVTLVGVGGPDWGKLGHGLTHWNFNNGSLTTALAYISTNASVTAGIYGTYLGLEKKWKKEDLFNGALLADAITHVILVVLISGAIVLVGAIVLNPTGTAIKAPAQLAELLVPIMGTAARFIMGIALVGAGFSSLLGNTQRGVVLLGAGIDKERGRNHHLLLLRRIPDTADLYRERTDINRYTDRRFLHPSPDLPQGRQRGIRNTEGVAVGHGGLLHFRSTHDDLRSFDTDSEPAAFVRTYRIRHT